MRRAPGICALAASLVVAVGPAAVHAGEWTPLGNDLQMDAQSVERDATGFTIWLKEPDATREGLPSVATSLMRARIDCRLHTSQFLALDLHAADGHSLDGVRPNVTRPLPIVSGSVPDRLQKRFCPTVR